MFCVPRPHWSQAAAFRRLPAHSKRRAVCMPRACWRVRERYVVAWSLCLARGATSIFCFFAGGPSEQRFARRRASRSALTPFLGRPCFAQSSLSCGTVRPTSWGGAAPCTRPHNDAPASGLGRTWLECTRECVLGCGCARIRERVDECASARASAIVHAPIFVRYLLRRLRLRFNMSRRRLLSDTCRRCYSRLLCRLLCRLGRFRGALNGIGPIGRAPVEHVQQGRLHTRATMGLDGTREATLAFASAAAAASLASSAPACGCQPSHSSEHAT
jgi:hypothetical protein